MSLLYKFFGWIMKLCYSVSFNNYILTLFLFALIIQVILFPLGIKQQKSTVKRAKLRPKEEEIMRKYRGQNDRATQQKMQMEIQEMYKAEGYSPMAGCLPLLIQFPIIIALFGVVRAPLTYMTNLNKTGVGESGYNLESFYQRAYEVIDNQTEAYKEREAELQKLKAEAAEKAETEKAEELGEKIEHCKKRIAELKSTKASNDNKSGLQALTEQYREMKLIKFMQGGVDEFFEDFAGEGGTANIGKAELVLADKASFADYENGDYVKRLLVKEDAAALRESERVYDFNDMLADKGFGTEDDDETAAEDADKGAAEKGVVWKNGAHSLPDFDFIGSTTILDKPSYTKFNWLLLVPLLVFLSSFWSSEVTRKLSGPPPAGQQKTPGGGFMRWGMPAMSTFFAFTFPAAIGVYWTVRSAVVVGQQYLLTKMYPPPVFTEAELKEAVKEIKQAKKMKKVVTIEVDEDDTSYDGMAISEERAEKLRRRRSERLRREDERAESGGDSRIERPDMKDGKNRKERRK